MAGAPEDHGRGGRRTAKLGLIDEALATGLARALEEHGPMEAVRKAWAAAVARLRAEHAKLTGEVAALRRERDGLTAAITAVQEAGIAEVREMADIAAAEVRRAAAQFERVATEAAELGQTVQFAQALRSSDPELWSPTPGKASSTGRSSGAPRTSPIQRCRSPTRCAAKRRASTNTRPPTARRG